MNCFRHEHVAAVAQCSLCGVGLCSECVKNSEYTIDNKPLCRSCNYKSISDMVIKDKSRKKWTLVKLIINAFFILLGLIIYMSSGSIGNAILIFAIGGIPTAWKLLSNTPEDRIRNSIYDATTELRDGVGSSIMNSFFRFIFRVIFTVVIGAIAAPIILIINIVKLSKCTKRIALNESLLAKFE